MKIRKIISLIENIAPLDSQEEWDNSGVQIMTDDGNVSRILVALEITDEVISEAKDFGAEMIITHHPLIFGGTDNVSVEDVTGRYILELVSSGISVYASHTPFDKAPGGNNDWLAEKIDLQNVEGFSEGVSFDMIGRCGDLTAPLSLFDLSMMVSTRMDIPFEQIRTVGDVTETINRVAICTGAGADLADKALENGCDVLITGDVKYHDAQNAKAKGLCLIDAGHYGTEKTFAENFADKLRKELLNAGDTETMIIESSVDIYPFSV